MDNTRLTDKSFWDNTYEHFELADFQDHAVADFLRRYLQDGHGKTSLEAGSFPGSFIPTVGRKGYRVHGVDFNEKNVTQLPAWLRSLQLEVGEFWTADFFDFVKDERRRFDLVCSFGLIEHFENFEEVIKTHMDLVKPGGMIVITTPNFRGWLQQIPHRLFDKPNLDKHYLPSMNPYKWKRLMENNGFEVRFAGYFGGYDFWVEPIPGRSGVNQFFLTITQKSIRLFRRAFRALHLESGAFSGFCGIVAVRKNAPAS